MKIEKINDFQIRCTLTSNDLASRGIRVGELAYGTDRVRGLFQEIMQSAREQYDFQTDDLPVMVEAIPISSECMVLVITVSEDPEELDTRFSSFAPSVMNDEDEEEDMEEEDVFEDLVHDDDISSLFERIQEGGLTHLFSGSLQDSDKKVKARKMPDKEKRYSDPAKYRIYSFPLLMDIIRVASMVNPSIAGRNTLFKNQNGEGYLLVLYHAADTGKDDPHFSRTCLILSEYGSEIHTQAVSDQYLEEHSRILIKDNALQTLHS